MMKSNIDSCFRRNDTLQKSTPPNRRIATFNFRSLVGFLGMALLCHFLLFLSGCATQGGIPAKQKLIFLESIANRTVQPELGVVFTQKLTDELLQDGSFDIVGREAAEELVSGEIYEFSMTPYSYSQKNEVEEYVIGIKGSLSVKNKEELRTVELSGDSRYFTSLKLDGVFNPAKEESLKARAIADCLEYLSRQAVDKLR